MAGVGLLGAVSLGEVGGASCLDCRAAKSINIGVNS